MIRTTEELIATYVEKDPTKFCTFEEFGKGVDAREQFCTLRVKSVQGQLDGTIPSTTDGQSANDTNLIDASELNSLIWAPWGWAKDRESDVPIWADRRIWEEKMEIHPKNRLIPRNKGSYIV